MQQQPTQNANESFTLIFCPSTIYDVVGLRKMIGSVGTGLFSSNACSLLNICLQKINSNYLKYFNKDQQTYVVDV